MSKLKQGVVGIVLSFVLFGVGVSANAALLTWTLEATGAGNATASGFLEFDALATAVGDFSIALAGGGDPLFSDFTFTPGNANVLSVGANGTITMQTKQPTATIDRFLSFVPASPGLTDSGGTVSVTLLDTRIQGSTEFPINLTRSFTGSVTTTPVPEPSSLLFMVLGVLVLGALLNSRRR